jgi:hypothetical protein
LSSRWTWSANTAHLLKALSGTTSVGGVLSQYNAWFMDAQDILDISTFKKQF